MLLDHLPPQLAVLTSTPAPWAPSTTRSPSTRSSHPLWQDDAHIIVWGPHAGEIHYHLYHDTEGGAVEVIGRDVLVENGHMTFSPVNKRWMLSDTYPDDRTHERLFLFDM